MTQSAIFGNFYSLILRDVKRTYNFTLHPSSHVPTLPKNTNTQKLHRVPLICIALKRSQFGGSKKELAVWVDLERLILNALPLNMCTAVLANNFTDDTLFNNGPTFNVLMLQIICILYICPISPLTLSVAWQEKRRDCKSPAPTKKSQKFTFRDWSSME